MKPIIITPGDELGNELGFTKELFSGYIAKEGDYIWISAIISLQKNRHHLSHLFDKINSKGMIIKVPNPFPHMEEICKAKGFIKTVEHFPEMEEDIDVWVRVP